MTKKTKVTIVGPAFPLRGGIANFNEALCRSLQENGYETNIVSFSYQYPKLLFPGKSQFDKGNPPKGLKIDTMINSINPINWMNVARTIKADQPTFVIIRFWLPFMAPCLGSIAKLIKRNTNIKVIAITDNIIPHEKRPGDVGLTKFFIKHVDGFVTMSKAVLKELEEFTNSANKVFLPHPIYDIFGSKMNKIEAQTSLGLSTNDKHILFFGFIRKYKGLDLLLNALADNRIKELGVKLIIAGEFYDEEQPYIDLMQSLGIDDRVILKTSFIPKEEVAKYFCASDMVTQTYRTASQSGVTQIAYHFNRPMLVTDTGGLSEIVPHNKVGYVTAINPQAIADAIVDFYSNNKETEFSEAVAIEKERFTWRKFIEGIQYLYDRLN